MQNPKSGNLNEILFISYPFPPLGAAGALRPFRFAKNLPGFQWQPIVLTIKERPDVAKDYSLLDQLPDEVIIRRTQTFFPGNIIKNIKKIRLFSRSEKGSDGVNNHPKFFLNNGSKGESSLKKIVTSMITTPDHHVFWVPIGVSKGAEIIKKNKVKIIFTTSPPHSSQLVGAILKKLYKLPWVADFRDPWVENFDLRGDLFNWQKLIEKKLEKIVIHNADRIIANTETNKNNLLKRHPGQPEEKFITIHNGFEDSNNSEPIESFKKFTITHTGIFYPQVGPYFFFEALADWLSHQDKTIRSNIQVLLVGEVQSGETGKIVNNLKLRDIVEFIDRVPHKEALNIARSSDMLLVSLGFNKKNKGWVPMKIYDYLTCQSPILAFLPEGDAADIILKTQSGYVVSCPDVAVTQTILAKEYRRKINGDGSSPKRDWEKISCFNNRNLAKKLAYVFDSLI